MSAIGLHTRYRVPRRVLQGSRTLLLPSAERQLEGMVVWWGRPPRDDGVAEVTAVYRPRQHAYRSAAGLSVAVPEDAISEMIVALPAGMVVLARLHTHGTVAYHSEMDDANMLIAHQGAVSIVIPFFARQPIDLEGCSVNLLDHARGWVELEPEDVRARFEVVDG